MNDKVKIFRYITEGTFDSYSWQVIENKQKFISQIMTSKSPVRSCEDIDETALSYAEVKALAAGNPYIREKMDLDVQVSRLRLLKANHDSQRYWLEDNIAQHYPAQIASLRSQAEGCRFDIQLHEQNRPKDKDEFSMKIGSITYTSRKDAGPALINICRSVEYSDLAVSIGEYRGFQMSYFFNRLCQTITLRLKGSLTHEVDMGQDPSGNLRRLDNALDALPEKMADAEQRLANVERQLENAKAEAVKPFPKEAELAEKTARLHTLNALLNMDEKVETVFLEDGEVTRAADNGSHMSEERDVPDVQKTDYEIQSADTSVVAETSGAPNIQKSNYASETAGKDKHLSGAFVQSQESRSAACRRVSIKEKMAAMREAQPQTDEPEKRMQPARGRTGTQGERKERISIKDKIAQMREKDGLQSSGSHSRRRQREAL